MIRSGTTAFNDMYFFMDEAARAVDEAGIRAVLSYGFIDLNNPEKRENECRATEKLAARIRTLNNPRITAAAGPHAIYTVSPEGSASGVRSLPGSRRLASISTSRRLKRK